MSAENDNLDQCYDVVMRLVEEAGQVWHHPQHDFLFVCNNQFFLQIINSRNDQRKTVVMKSSDVDLLTETDQEVEKLLMDNLSKAFPSHK